MYRLPKDKWNSFYGGLDIYNRLVLHMKDRRENFRRYMNFKEQKKRNRNFNQDT
jgi:hypothetical protein